MYDSKIIHRNFYILDVIFYPNKYWMNKNQYKFIWKTDDTPILLLKDIEARTNYVWPLIREV